MTSRTKVYIIVGIVLLVWVIASRNRNQNYISSNTQKISPTLTNTSPAKSLNEPLIVTPTTTPFYTYPTDTPTPEPTYFYPTATPIPMYQPTSKSCITNGNFTTCSDGSSYLTNGNLTTVNGGTNGNSGSCLKNGIYVSCTDGSTAIQNGNFTTYSGNGTSGTCIQNGPWKNCSDGSSTYNPNY